MNECHTNDRDGNTGEFICGVVEGFYGKPWSCGQRKDLFKRLKEFKLNSFMYAPKDDTKHRAKWRQPYSESEAEDLKTLIDEAKANGINFFYSLAPGLDMVYSDAKEIKLLIEKYNQLVGLGCESFAILFDDIEPSIINEEDREMFKCYASAQVYVTNIIFNHLKRPKFLFCPTEYCESRTVPNLANSIYLKSLGSGLQQGIDIMWSGSRVISRLITEESIDSLTKVIKRPPIIWENLHANDYDKKRIYLGPYSGRSTKIISKLRGVLTNPNCEYEANYIAIHTLARWSRCTVDINLNNSCDHSVERGDGGSTVTTTSTTITSSAQQLTSSDDPIYDPFEALALAIKDWLPLVLERKTLPSDVNLPLVQRSDETASHQLVKEVDCDVKDIDVEESSNMDILGDETQLSATSVSTNKSEMDISGPSAEPIVSETNSCDSCEMQIGTDFVLPAVNTQDTSNSGSEESQLTLREHQLAKEVDCIMSSSEKLEKPETGPIKEKSAVNLEDLNLLVDLFYLPFEHGFSGKELLKDIKWLKENHDKLLVSEDGSAATKTASKTSSPASATSGCTITQESEAKEMQMSDDNGENPDMNCISSLSWMARAKKLDNLCTSINTLVNNLIYNCPNQLLIVELYPYLVDMRDMSTMIIDYIKFLRCRTSTMDCFHSPNTLKAQAGKEPPLIQCLGTCIEEQEPWIHRGGLIGDVQRLLP